MAEAAKPNADIPELSYEDARDELVSIVSRLEGGQASLEDSMRLWERGEALADHCTRYLDGAQARLDRQDATAPDANAAGPADQVDQEDDGAVPAH